MKHNILIIDDEIAILQMLTSYFDDMYHIKKAINGKTALRFIKEHTPDIIIVDWMLPDILGVEIVSWIRNQEIYKHIPIIILTAKSSQADKVQAFEVGVDDYMVKPVALLELGARIKALLRRSGESKDIIVYQELSLNVTEQVFYIHNTPLHIVSKEFKLLKLLIKHPQRIWTREQIISRLYVGDDSVNNRTIDVLISRVRKHLLQHDCNMLQTIRGLGYKLAAYE
jgi:two-component system phosphate regulon response regulator PhoB